MNNKTFKSITGIVLATAIGMGGYQLGRQSNAPEPKRSFPEQYAQLPNNGAEMTFTCSPASYDVFIDRNGDGNHEIYQRQWYSNSEGSLIRSQEDTLYHPLSIQEVRTVACR